MKTSMKIFMAIIALHWVEHLFQAYQVYVMHMDRACALGFLGMKYPWLIRTESLHFAFAMFTMLGMFFVGKNYFMSYGGTKAWVIGFLWSVWHSIEHTLLFFQAVSHHYLFGHSTPISIIQLIVPRIELHLFYNSIITYYIMKALFNEYRYQRYARAQVI